MSDFKFMTAQEWVDKDPLCSYETALHIQANAIRFAAQYCKRIREFNEIRPGSEGYRALLAAENHLNTAAVMILDGKAPEPVVSALSKNPKQL